MYTQTLGFQQKKGLNFCAYNKGFLNYEDFILSINNDSELINRLGFSRRIKKGNIIKVRTESDYLFCYKHYLDNEMDKFKNNKVCFVHLNRAYKILIYLINQKNYLEGTETNIFFDEKQSIMLAKLKSIIRSIIIEHNIYKFNIYNISVA